MKKRLTLIALAALTFLCAQKAFSESYKISEVKYDIKGRTKAAYLNRVVEPDLKKTFESIEELEAYIQTLTRAVQNTRQFESVTEEHEFGTESDGIIEVRVLYTLIESFHFLALPIPKYNSNSGFELNLKIKDSNFLGLMEPFTADLNYKYDNDENHHIGFNLNYSYPFQTGIFQNSINSSASFDWVIGDNEPSFDFNTGISTRIPLGAVSLTASFTQSLSKNPDYNYLGDGFYLTEKASIGAPIRLGLVSGTIPVVYTPSVSFTYYWDPVDLQISSGGLKSPKATLSQNLSTSSIKWKGRDGNLRNGFSLSANTDLTWNFKEEEKPTKAFSADVNLTVQLFKAWKYGGIASRIYLYTAYNAQTSVSESLRGVRDSTGGRYSSTAMVFNFDFPVHVITTDWANWDLKLFGPYDERNGFVKALTFIPYKLFPYLNFELQVSPFVDMAFTYNDATKRLLYWRDGFYTAGVEVLVYPQKWKSYVVRASFGVDIGRTFFKSLLDTSWRGSPSRWELYIGLGTSY